MTKKVVIASRNPTKINAVKAGFEKMFPEEHFEFEGVTVPSGVEDQPMGNQETLTGAINRSDNARVQIKNADYWVGIEGGITKINNEMEVYAWIVIKSNNQTGKAKTGTFFLPKKVVELISSGMELGEADNIVFRQTNSKKKSGAVGILTKDVIDRTHYYTEAIILALIPFNNPEIY